MVEGLAAFAVVLVLFVRLSADLGLTWDESIYFHFSDSISAWFTAGADLSQEALTRAWAFDPFLNSHPELFRVLDAIGAWATSSWLSFPMNYRIAHLTYAALALALVFMLLRGSASVIEAGAAICFVALLPRSLGDLLLANSDGPVVAGWLAAVTVAWRLESEEDARLRLRFRLLLIVVCGLLGASKVTGILAIPPLGLFFAVRRKWREIPVVAAGFIAGLVLPILTSPEKWADPIGEVVKYLAYPSMRAFIPIATTYLGRVYTADLPWHYFWVMSLVTVPIPIWLCLPGLAMAPRAFRSLAWSAGLSVLFWAFVATTPSTPRHDGVRQFVTVYPLIALLGWIGALGYLRRFAEEHPEAARRTRTPLLLAVPVLLLLSLASVHPHQLSYYNGLIGGLSGAEKTGMEITYYFDALGPEAVRAIEANVRPEETLALSPSWPRLIESYRTHGHPGFSFRIVRAGEPADWLLLYRRRHTVDDAVYLRLPAVYERKHDGVSLLKLVRARDVPSDVGYPAKGN